MGKYLPICLLVVLLLGIETSTIEGANILGVFSSYSPSHVIVHLAVVKTLADRGHNVTVLTQMAPKFEPHENVTVIVAAPSPEQQSITKEYMARVSSEKESMWSFMTNLFLRPSPVLNGQYEWTLHPKIKAIYENPQTKYDLVILGLMLNDFQLGFAAKLRCPVIMTWVGVPMPSMDSQVANIDDPSFVPSLNVALEPGKLSMGFRLRCVNFITHSFLSTINVLMSHKMQEFYNQAFGKDSGPDFPSYYDMKRRISLLFYNYHAPSEGPIRPTVPQSIEIGGIQVKEKPDPLPKDLAEFLDNATDGAIFFSLGTNVKFTGIRPQSVEFLYKALSKLPQRVVWKWDDMENTPGNASNIYFGNWLPQDDILAHPKTRLFITHAGKGGIAEAQYHGVPMLAFPIFADQPGNAEMMVKSGFGLHLDILTLTEEILEKTIRELLLNPSYRESVGRFSALYRDRPLTARQSVVYWTEYVLRHQGAYHLQSPLLHMNFVARHNLDVYGIVLVFALVSLLILRMLFRFVFRKVLRVLRGHSYRTKASKNKLKDKIL
ncbi:UDP-glucuronosyltransferase 2A1 [Drosophila subobscura]|uniref:UDP-glucuronosyltransferase 2A1 n=1 Tax=Drosophila subobscura TaxID=7241 RepID=UPI00155B2C8D|nr:UDP-glucuronosyltransferase 2A1 [Drosophila subobscura]